MARRYGQPVSVTLKQGMPASFRWRGCRYPIAEVFATWHLVDRWWEVRPSADLSTRTGAQNRTYYRVCCRGPAGEQVFDLYHDAVTNQWVLDIIHD